MPGLFPYSPYTYLAQSLLPDDHCIYWIQSESDWIQGDRIGHATRHGRLFVGPYLAGGGRSATNRSDTVNSSNWKCGFMKATAR
jgi:hypothetical protein